MGAALTPTRVARGVLALGVLVPWLGLAPIAGALGLALAAIAITASFAGWGRLVARLAKIEDAPLALLVHWGLAAAMGLAGLALVAHQLGHAVQLAIVIAGLALHGALLVVDRARHEAQLAAFLRAPDARYWILPALGLVAVAALHVLGTAGDPSASPFDDDGHVPAQVARLWQTGVLGDPLGYARDAQLGGHVTASALVTSLAGTAWFRLVDALGFAFLLWLAIARLRPRTPATSTAAMLLVFVAASYPAVATDATPRWLATSLLLALFSTFERYAAPEDDRELWPLGLLAAAVCVLRSELIPIGVAMLASAGLLAIGRSGSRRRTYALLVIPLACVLAYVVARLLARGAVPASVLGGRHGVLGPLLAFAGMAIVAIAAPVAITRGPRRWIAIAALLGLAGIVAQLTGTRPYALGFVWPILVAAGFAVASCAQRAEPTELGATTSDPRAITLVLALLAATLIYDGRDATGRGRWVRRYADLASSIEYVRHAYPSAPTPDPYARILASAPPGSTVAVWVARPERLDFRAHRILDLRTPRAAPRRAAVLRALHPDFLLVEDDHLPAERARRDLWYRLACPPPATEAFCLDDFQMLVQTSPEVASDGTLRLVRLRR